MNKEDVLERSRAEKVDEGMQEAENRGRRIGEIAFCGVFIFITLFNFFKGQPNYAPMAMLWAFLAAESYPKYQFSKNKSYLVATIAGTVASIASLVSFVISNLG